MTAQCLICCAEFENRTSKRYCSKKCKQQARNIVRNMMGIYETLKRDGRLLKMQSYLGEIANV